MKKTLFSLLLGTIAVGGLAQTASAQGTVMDEADPTVIIQPQPEVGISPSVGSTHGHVIHEGAVVSHDGFSHDGGYVMGGNGEVRHYDMNRIQGARHMVRDRYHPHPVYAHSRRGAHATMTHEFNEQQAMAQQWHGNYYHYQYGAPLALVVPPTASFQSNYSWGVGRTTSTPIYHQYTLPGSGMPIGADGGYGGYNRTPYYPSHTGQFGVYYIRGPW